jgi:ABC-type transport system involved in multi-copper enzyme maturation permease subunit
VERLLRSYVWRAVAYFAVLEAMLAVAIAFWPDFERGIPYFKTISSLPFAKDLLKPVEQTGVQGYVLVQHFFKGCNVLGTAAAVLFAMGAVAGEAHRGTLEIWLARPLSRRRLLLERWIGGALALCLPVFVSSATVPGLLGTVGASMAPGGLLLASAHQSLFLLAFYALTFLFSCVGSRPFGIAFGMLLFTTFEFALYMVTTATHWSVFRMSDYQVYGRVVERGALDLRLCGPLALFSALCLAASLAAFARRVP